MVLWEITLATAYFLGLKRTYRLALKIQRRLTGKHPKIRQWLHRRTRSVFDVAVKFHRQIQQRDIEVGRNLGNCLLRWLDKLKPAAQIRGDNPTRSANNTIKTTKKQSTDSSHQKTPGGCGTSSVRNGERDSSRRLFSTSPNIWHTAYPTIAMMMSPSKPVGTNTPYRQFLFGANSFELKNQRFGIDGVIRKDIIQWMRQN